MAAAAADCRAEERRAGSSGDGSSLLRFNTCFLADAFLADVEVEAGELLEVAPVDCWVTAGTSGVAVDALSAEAPVEGVDAAVATTGASAGDG